MLVGKRSEWYLVGKYYKFMRRKNHYNITNVLIPPDKVMLTKAYKLVVDKDIRVSELINVITKDPVLVLEVFKAGNRAYLEANKICDLSQIIHNLGFDALKKVLIKLRDREVPTTFKVQKAVNNYREQAVKVSEVSSIIAKYVSNDLVEKVKIGGLFITIGYILVLLYLGVDFIEFEDNPTPQIIKLELEAMCHFNVEKLRLEYLSKYLPMKIVGLYDPKADFAKTSDEYRVKEIIECAKDFITTYNENILNPHAPLEEMFEKSFFKSLPFTNDERNKIINEIIAYLTWYSFGKA